MSQGAPRTFDFPRFIFGIAAALLVISIMRNFTFIPPPNWPDYKTTLVVSTEKVGQNIRLRRITKEGVFDEHFVPLETVTNEKGEAHFADLFVPSIWQITTGWMRKTINYTIQIREPTITIKMSFSH